MIRSMTGFGAASGEAEGSRFAVEIRAVNGKFYKSSVRLPDELLPLEPEIDQSVAKRLGRGSVTISVRFTPAPGAVAAAVNRAVVQAYLDQVVAAVPEAMKDRVRIDPATLLSLPGALAPESGDHLIEAARPILTALVAEACERLLEMRRREGETLAVQLREIVAEIRERLERVAVRAPQVVDGYRERLRSRIDALLSEMGTTVKDEDLIREVAIYAERSDIAEEVIRLRGHLEQFEQALVPEGGRPAGRVLDFLAQEMLRETNTIASKSGDSEISREVVEIKGLIDRTKEQAQNVE